MVMTYEQRIAPFAPQRLEAICRILAHTETGLAGTEIGDLLGGIGIPDPSPQHSKWRRLYEALNIAQDVDLEGYPVLLFIQRAMDPIRYPEKPRVFHDRRDRLNSVLAFCGLTLGADCQFHSIESAQTLDQALARANRLHVALEQRAVHQDVLKFCKAEILQENYFHTVFEAMKSITSKIRTLSGLTGDGADLVYDAFGQKHGPPRLAINPLQTDTQRGEQRGFVNLLKGLYGTIRNPLAHDPKVEWDMTEQDALDILTTISLVHRKLDLASCYRY